MEQQYSILKEGVTKGAAASVVEGRIYSGNCLYNAVVEMRVPRQGGEDIRKEIFTPCPVTHEEAKRLVLSIVRLERDGRNDFNRVKRRYIQRVNMPVEMSEEDRWNGAWGRVERPWIANKADDILRKHYRRTVQDAEAATVEDQWEVKVRTFCRMSEESRKLVDVLVEYGPEAARNLLVAHYPSLLGGTV